MKPNSGALRGIAVLAAATCSLALASSAAAEPPDFLTRLSAGEGAPGDGAAQVDNPRGVAADPDSGHVYVADFNNARINTYTAWGLFVRSWGWGVADGSEELQSCGPAEPEFDPPEELCGKGSAGEGKGQFAVPLGIEVDPAGSVYVFDRANLRVQKFSPEGEFVLMFGGEVNKTTTGDVCTEESGDECGKGVAGTEPSHFAATIGNYIAYSPTADAILVGDKDRIQVFNLDGTYREEIGFEGELAAFDEETVNGLDVDSAGNIYFSLSGSEDVFKLSEAGEPLAPGLAPPGASKFEAENPLGVAVDVEGSVYVIDDPPGTSSKAEARVTIYDAEGQPLVPTEAEAEAFQFFPYIPFNGPGINGIATNLCAGSEEPGSLYLTAFKAGLGATAYADAYGTPPIGCEEPPDRPPHIVEQYATEVGVESAKLRAEINPRFWADTKFRLEYGKGECPPAPEPCEALAPDEEGLVLTEDVTSEVLKGAPITIGGLEPGTEYSYRFVAQSSGGGPVYGEGGGEAEGAGFREVGEDGTFTTFKAPAPKGSCPNDAFRVGAGAELPDCRGYEMVSPLDKEGGDAGLWQPIANGNPIFFELHQSAPSGSRFTFSSTQSFDGAESASFATQYLAERGGASWSSEPISAPMAEVPISAFPILGNGEYHLFSEDLCQGWFRNYSTAPLSKEAIPGYINLYKRRNCGGTPLYEALTTAEPPDLQPVDYNRLRAYGASADGSRAIFVANDALAEDAPKVKSTTQFSLYEHGPEGLRFVCYLPGGGPVAEACAAGTAADATAGGRQSSTRNAISADGERIFWTAFEGEPGGGPDPGSPGPIYARIGGEETVEISGQVSAEDAWYWTAAEDGSKVIFSFGNKIFNSSRSDELYEVDVDEAIAEDPEAATPIAEGVRGPLGASEDASVLYFASSEDLDEGGPGEEGAHNLYRYEAGPGGGEDDYRFVMELVEEDMGGELNNWAPIDGVPVQRSARVTPDGRYATFSSFAPPPSGYENLDAETGEPVQEVYRYDAEADGGAGEVICVSCNPSGARAPSQGGAAARIQGWEAQGHAPGVISDDGSRVFFESLDSLVPRDSNQTWDVYQWEAPGKGSCTKGDPAYTEATKGCVDLISSGKSPAKSTFLDADPAGRSAFIGTQSSLVGPDYGLNDVYAVRIGGGFPEPEQAPECEGEACQSPDPAPEAQTPASATYAGAGNEQPPTKAPPCIFYARLAHRHARRSKTLRAKARKAARAAKRSGSRPPRRRARRLRSASRRKAKAAKRSSVRAKRCRRAARRAAR